MTPDEVHRLLEEYRTRIRDAAVRWRQEHRAEHDLWTIETVKHLAFVNAAGLAGAGALYASDKMATKAVVFCNVPSALFFAVGLALAVVDMYLNSMGALARMEEVDRRLRAWDAKPNPGEADARELLGEVRNGMAYFEWAGRVGWLSAIAFLIGAYPFALLSF